MSGSSSTTSTRSPEAGVTAVAVIAARPPRASNPVSWRRSYPPRDLYRLRRDWVGVRCQRSHRSLDVNADRLAGSKKSGGPVTEMYRRIVGMTTRRQSDRDGPRLPIGTGH